MSRAGIFCRLLTLPLADGSPIQGSDTLFLTHITRWIINTYLYIQINVKLKILTRGSGDNSNYTTS